MPAFTALHAAVQFPVLPPRSASRGTYRRDQTRSSELKRAQTRHDETKRDRERSGEIRRDRARSGVAALVDRLELHGLKFGQLGSWDGVNVYGDEDDAESRTLKECDLREIRG